MAVLIDIFHLDDADVPLLTALEAGSERITHLNLGDLFEFELHFFTFRKPAVYSLSVSQAETHNGKVEESSRNLL
jgi:hypothetical protein